MAAPKQNRKDNQHFVPRFYLKNFAVDGTDRRAISLFRLSSEQFVPIASIESQASAHRFYKHDELENGLAQIEGGASAIIRRAIEGGGMPLWKSTQHVQLMAFAFSQAFRTKVAAEEILSLARGFRRELESARPDITAKLGRMRINEENAPGFMVQVICEYMPLVFDLRYKLFRNQTPVPFVTSDHPAVLYNQFLEEKGAVGNLIGLGSMGLQLFLPISPRNMIAIFDGEVYKFGKHQRQVLVEDVWSTSDVKSLNALQAANAGDHLYFDHKLIAERSIRAIVEKARRFRRTEFASFRTLREENSITGQDALIVGHAVAPRTNLNLKCVGLTPTAIKYDVRGKINHMRSNPLLDLLKVYRDEVDRGGRSDEGGFLSFLKEFAPIKRDQR